MLEPLKTKPSVIRIKHAALLETGRFSERVHFGLVSPTDADFSILVDTNRHAWCSWSCLVSYSIARLLRVPDTSSDHCQRRTRHFHER